MNKKLIPYLLIGGALLAGCDQKSPTDTTAPATAAPATTASEAPAVAKEDTVAIVNGSVISKAAFETLEKEIEVRAQGQKFPKKQLLEELIQREVLVQDARKKHLDQSSEVKSRIDMAERSLLSQADLQDYLKANPVTDADLKTAYDKEVVAKMSGTEYRARHILVKTEDEAKKLIAQLGKGGKFDELAKKHSLDPSKSQGGDLGWFTAGQMVEPFSKAVAALEKGKYTPAPVQTQFGWHVILREDSRPQTPPAFEAIKEQMRPLVQQQKVQTMLEGLRKQAKVEILMSTEEPKVPTPVAPPPADAAATPVLNNPTTDKTATDKPVEPAKTEATTAATDKAATPVTDKPAEPTKAENTAASAATPATTEPAKK